MANFSANAAAEQKGLGAQPQKLPPLIIHTEASPGRGGQEARIFAEMSRLRDRGYRCAIVASAKSWIFTKCRDAGFDAYAIDFTKPGQLFDFLRLVSLFKKLKPQVVGTHSSVDSWVGLAAATVTRVPVRLRYRHVSVPTKNNATNRFLYKNLCDAVVTTGECISVPLAQSIGLPRRLIHTIPTGITPPATLPTPAAARAALQLQLHLGADARFIGMVAVMRHWKGHDVLMRAFGQLPTKFANHHLVFVGEGQPSMDYFRSVAASLPCASRIHFVGHRENIYDYFRAFDIALLTSTKNEGIPQSLLQAMFAGTPVVGTDVGGIPEIVHDGVTGLVVAGGDVSALAKAIEVVLDDPASAEARAKAAMQFVRENHTIEVMGAKIEALIAEILEKKLAKEVR